MSFGSRIFVRQLIALHGWGEDPVIVEAQIKPGRALVQPMLPEILLVGGLAPEEFVATHEVDDFIT